MVLWLPAAGMHRPSIPFYEVFSGLLTRLTIIFNRLELHARRTHEILNQMTDHFHLPSALILLTRPNFLFSTILSTLKNLPLDFLAVLYKTAEDNKCTFLYSTFGLARGIAATLFSKDIRCTGQAQMS